VSSEVSSSSIVPLKEKAKKLIQEKDFFRASVLSGFKKVGHAINSGMPPQSNLTYNFMHGSNLIVAQ